MLISTTLCPSVFILYFYPFYLDCGILDIVFVVDESGSICDNDDTFNADQKICDNWRSVRRFLTQFISNNDLIISETGSHVGMVTYRDDVTVDWPLNRYD